MSQPPTKLSQTLQSRTLYLHSLLVKIGYPVPIPPSRASLQPYFTATDLRLQLIQYLVGHLYPGYPLSHQYRHSYDDDPHTCRLIKLSGILWQLGVMPVSRHTRNLDYRAYVEGLLGEETAIGLLVDLGEMAQAKFWGGGGTELVAGDMIGEIVRARGELVNLGYDAYGVTFPGRYYLGQGAEQNMLEIRGRYKELVQDISQNTKQVSEQEVLRDTEDLDNTERLLSELDGFKQLFQHKYTKLQNSISKIVKKYQNIIPQQPNVQIAQLHNSRMLKIDRNLCKNYKKYSKLLAQIPEPYCDPSITDLHTQAQKLIKSLNQLNPFQN